MDEKWINEFVVGFGFLSGVWAAVGIDPEAEIFTAFIKIIESLQPDSTVILILRILPFIIFFVTLFLIYRTGGLFGLAAVGFSFIGGLLILFSPIMSIIFLIGGGSIAYFGDEVS